MSTYRTTQLFRQWRGRPVTHTGENPTYVNQTVWQSLASWEHSLKSKETLKNFEKRLWKLCSLFFAEISAVIKKKGRINISQRALLFMWICTAAQSAPIWFAPILSADNKTPALMVSEKYSYMGIAFSQLPREDLGEPSNSYREHESCHLLSPGTLPAHQSFFIGTSLHTATEVGQTSAPLFEELSKYPGKT